MKACPDAHCGWLFYDASRNASSTWCSMSICGNRTKTAAYRRRKAGVVRSALVRRRARTAAGSVAGTAARSSRRSGSPSRRPCSPACSQASTIATDRSTAQAIERSRSAQRVGSGGVVRDPRGPERAARAFSTRRRRGVRGDRARRPEPLRPLPREHRRRPLRRDHGRRRCRRRTSSCARVACRARARPSAAKCCGCVGAARSPTCLGLRLVQVGTAALRSTQLYGDFLRSTDAATADAVLAPALGRSGRYHRPTAGAARRRGGAHRARGRAGARAHVPDLRLGVAGRSRPAAPVGHRRLVATPSARAPS